MPKILIVDDQVKSTNFDEVKKKIAEALSSSQTYRPNIDAESHRQEVRVAHCP